MLTAVNRIIATHFKIKTKLICMFFIREVTSVIIYLFLSFLVSITKAIITQIIFTNIEGYA